MYSVRTRARIMWLLHVILPFATVLWGLWQIYFNLELVRNVVNDSLQRLAEVAEKALGPLVGLVMDAFEAVNDAAVLFTAHFNSWLRPVSAL